MTDRRWFGFSRGIAAASLLGVGWMGCGLALAAPRAAARPKAVTLSPWEKAEADRAAFLDLPEDARTLAEYTRVMNGYRAIYHGNPADVHAPEAVFNVGALLADEGEVLKSRKASQDAIGQFEFLRAQYPLSKLRTMALMAEAKVALDDLQDRALAKERFTAVVQESPRSTQAAEARDALAAMKDRRGGAVKAGTQTAESSKAAGAKAVISTDAGPVGEAPVPLPSRSEMAAADGAVVGDRGRPGRGTGSAGLPAMATTAAATPTNSNTAAVPVGTPASKAEGSTQPVKGDGRKLAGVTGIRHWSTPTYTRVAIDLGDEVKYEAARVPHPDRIYFDLHGTKLAAELANKSFKVTDDGFLTKIRAAQFSDDMTRIVLDVNDVTEYTAFLLPNPYRLIIDVHGASAKRIVSAKAGSTDVLKGESTMEASVPPAHETEVAGAVPGVVSSPVPSAVATKISATTGREVAGLSQQPDKVKATQAPTTGPVASKTVTVAANHEPAAEMPVPVEKSTRKGTAQSTQTEDESADRTAVPTQAGQRSLVRALGLKISRIVIDAGHGGHDVGTIGAGGLFEKDVVLDVALRLGKKLHEQLGAEITYTRSDDTFIPLETRTAIANKAQADLFISIHANSSSDTDARGVEVYYLNFTASPDALDVAARENRVSNNSIHELSDLVKKITLKDKIDESREFAADVDESLYGGLQQGNAGLKNRGVKKAPFVVLIGANMPSILAEISFVTNPKDASQLRQPEYRQRVADSLYRGVARYANGLSGMRVAQAGIGGR